MEYYKSGKNVYANINLAELEAPKGEKVNEITIIDSGSIWFYETDGDFFFLDEDNNKYEVDVMYYWQNDHLETLCTLEWNEKVYGFDIFYKGKDVKKMNLTSELRRDIDSTFDDYFLRKSE